MSQYNIESQNNNLEPIFLVDEKGIMRKRERKEKVKALIQELKRKAPEAFEYYANHR